MESIWKHSTHEEYEKLSGDVKRNIVIIGGGSVGILTAYKLAEKGEKVTLIEAERLYSGTTHNTTAHITALQGYIYYDLAHNHSFEFANGYYNSQLEAIEEIKNLIGKHKIECDFENIPDNLFTMKNFKTLLAQYVMLLKMGAKAELVYNFKDINIKINAAIKLYDQATFNPIKFLDGLPKNFEIFENTRAMKIDLKKKIITTKNAKITANKIIIATNYPIVNVRGLYFTKLYKSQSYAISAIDAPSLNEMYQGDLENGLTFRSYNKEIIIGGLDHRSGRVNSNRKFDRLNEIAKIISSSAKITKNWTANDVKTFDGIPYIGKFSKKYKDIYLITGFNKWGMANSMASALLTSDLITGAENKYATIFSPQRKSIDFKSLIINLLVAVKNLLIKPILIPLKSAKGLKPGTGAIVMYKRRKKAVYKDIDNSLHICSPYCKHLGCQLKFNQNAKTWDCPCHGSRFDIDGKIINSPTVKPLKKYD